MKKSLFSEDYKCFLKLLREVRERAGLTQEQIAERLETTQSIISKCERGERRLDVVELKAWCQALDRPLPVFIAEFEKALTEGGK
ncbi:XRE family transcriptional regulator [Phormidesmis priestleyi ULC007]|uniref:XRE family transcriptional regulator n=1 Tax=Phormidesmis priestleyi ULC007 TaxID=1920490 RepID=A0A2T1DEW4_9CYAN|nr:helix-turn-helix transcriptional regulator [Phormidesmis priestleyi]PSB19028.1 XRE family transcriptional regulator [Phormidesmis priestleyi ULC007]PZO54016.1 MAG: XRE family transcriptional regulator [Phormidesmis priestleyi]